MILRNPEWLALLPLLLLAGWALPRLSLWRPLRVLLLILGVLMLARPQWRRAADGVDLWVLLDASVSAEKPMAKGVNEWRQLLERSRGREDRAFYLNYANEVMRYGAEGAEMYERNRLRTRTGMAVQQALIHAQRESSGRATRVLVFSDGYATEPLDGLAEKLAAQQVELDWFMVRDPEPIDFRVAALRVPARVQLGEPYLLEVEVRGQQDATVPVIIRRDGRELKRVEVNVLLGSGTARFTDRSGAAGVVEYEAVITPERDAHSGNNRHVAMVEVAGGPRVMLLTAYLNDPVAETLRRQGFTVETVTDLRSVRPGQLAGVKCVIFNNVPAFDLPAEFLAAMNFYVREQGGSLLMAGGQKSFAAGGYFESSIDPLLPVSMEMKQEHRKLLVAMSIVMDRSGSMGMTVQNGFTKMALADEGAANAIRFLGPQDLLSVFAVDREAHVVVPLQSVGPNRDKMESAVRRIESTGGGIFVYNGLKAAWDQLKDAPVGQRHIILFSDAADSEEPGDYKKLIAEVVANGGTISVIALGTRADPDAWLLDDIAKLGGGRIFYTDRAEELPSIFSQETVAVARSAFVQEPTGAQGAGGWFEISGQTMEWLKQVDGYNLSYLRDWASQALITNDEYAAPLVAFGQRGIGRTAAVSFPLGGKFSDSARAWSGYGDLLQTLVRWLMGENIPPGIGLKHRLEGHVLKLDLLHDETWEPRLTESPPRILLAYGTRAEGATELAWERLAPGHYQATAELPEGEMVRGAVQVGRQALTFGPALIGASTEWAFDEARVAELRDVVKSSGGRELLDLRDAWRGTAIIRFSDMNGYLLLAALVLMVLEALITRMGWRLPEWALVRRSAAKHSVRPSPAARAHAKTLKQPPAAAAKPAAPATSPPPPAEAKADDLQRRFDRAKRRGR
jgi:hypothetical protein